MITPMNTCMYVINMFMLTLKNKAKQNLVTLYKTCYSLLLMEITKESDFLAKISCQSSPALFESGLSELILFRHANAMATCWPNQALSCLIVLLLPTIQFCRPDYSSLNHKLANSNSRATPA